MSGPKELRAQQRLEWLVLIGQRLQQEYDALAKPLPTPLALLLQRLEARTTQVSSAEATPLVSPSHDTASNRDDGR